MTHKYGQIVNKREIEFEQKKLFTPTGKDVQPLWTKVCKYHKPNKGNTLADIAIHSKWTPFGA